jgi:SAM-dependent methyltransferase
MRLRDLAKRVGWRRHVRRCRVWLDLLPDRLLGIDTAPVVAHEQLGFGPDRGCHYEASPWRTLSSILPRQSVSQSDVFIDLGCGKGRIVLVAARYPFRRVIGVELSSEVASVARRNVLKVRGHLACRKVDIVVADLGVYRIPDDVTVAFCFNPVTGELFSQLLTSLNDSLARNPRELRLIYHNPTMQSLLLEAGWRELRRIQIQTNPDFRNDLAVYLSAPRSDTLNDKCHHPSIVFADPPRLA